MAITSLKEADPLSSQHKYVYTGAISDKARGEHEGLRGRQDVQLRFIRAAEPGSLDSRPINH